MRIVGLAGAALAATLMVCASPAQADSVTLNQTLTPGVSPKMPIITILSSACFSQDLFLAHYNATPVVVDTSGSYNFTLQSPGDFASLYIFDSTFDPIIPFPSCIAAEDTGSPIIISATLAAGALYYVVPVDDTFAQSGGAYTLTISGPGKFLQIAHVPTLSELTLGLMALLMAGGAAGLLGRRRSQGVAA